MSEQNKYKNYTAADIEKYHKGLLSSKERNELEKAALDDPFLADALEGYSAVPVNSSDDLTELKEKLNKRVGTAVVKMDEAKTSFKWWRAAAAVIILGGAGFLAYRLTTTHSDQPFAKNEEKKADTASGILNKKMDVTDTTTTNLTNTNKKNSRSQDNVSLPTLNVTASDKESKKGTDKPDSSYGVNSMSEVAVSPSNSEKKEMGPVIEKTKDDNTDKKMVRGIGAQKYKVADSAVTSSDEFLDVEKRSSKKNNIANNYFRGRVLDEDKTPLAFANITNTRDHVGTYTDAQGNFTLISSDSVLQVEVHSVGFENKNVLLKNNITNNQVVLNEDKSLPATVLNTRPAVNASRYRESNITVVEPEDGWDNYDTYLANNIKIPDDKRTKKFSGEVEVSFEVNESGEPINIKIEKSLCKKCDQEAIRLIKQGPKWKRNNRAARITVTIPFNQ